MTVAQGGIPWLSRMGTPSPPPPVSYIPYDIPMRPGRRVHARLLLPVDLTVAEAERLVRAIREAVSAHEAPGSAQWWADDLSIDCDADEFWKVAEQALAKALAEPGR
jgi:hypothetical protein